MMNSFKQYPVARLDTYYGSNRFYLLWRWWHVLLFYLSKTLNVQLTSKLQPTLLLQIVDDYLTVSLSSDGAKQFVDVEKIRFSQKTFENHDWSLISQYLKNPYLPVLILLKPHQVFSKQLILSDNIEDDLSQMLSYDMDRLTPMDASMVYYDYQIVERDIYNNKIHLVLYIVHRQVIDSLISELAHTPLRIHGIDVLQDISSPSRQGINLLPKEHRYTLPLRGLNFSIILTLLVVLFIGTGQWYSLQSKNEKISQLTRQLANLQSSSAAVIDLRKSVKEAEQSAFFIRSKRAQFPSLSISLHRLTHTLPDSTYIQQLHIKGDKIDLQGLSASAASLIPLLEKPPWFHEAILRSPITQDKNTQKERYKIRVSSNIPIINSDKPNPTEDENPYLKNTEEGSSG